MYKHRFILMRLSAIIVAALGFCLWWFNPLGKEYHVNKILLHINGGFILFIFCTHVLFFNRNIMQKEALFLLISFSIPICYLLFSPCYATVLGFSLVIINFICCIGMYIHVKLRDKRWRV